MHTRHVKPTGPTTVPVDVPAKANRIRCVVRDAQTEHVGTIDLQADTLTAMSISEAETEEAGAQN